MLSSKRRWNPKEELRRPSPELMNTNGSLPSLPSALAVLTGRAVTLPVSSICIQLGGQKVQTETRSGSEPEWKQDFRIAVPPGAADVNVSILGEQGEVAGEGSVSLKSVSGTRILTLQLHSPTRVLVGEVCVVLFYAPTGGATAVSATSSTRTFRRKPLSATPGPKTVNLGSDASSNPNANPNGNPISNPNSNAALNGDPKPNENPNGNLNQNADPNEDQGSSPNGRLAANGSAASHNPSPPFKTSAGSRLLSMGAGILAMALTLMAINKRTRRSFFYEVKAGDSICSIAGCYGLTPDVVVEANIIVADDPDRIYPGDKLFLP